MGTVKIKTEVEIDIDIDDHLNNASYNALIEEILDRKLRVLPEPACNSEELIQAIDESAMILRRDGRADLAFRLDELRKES